MSTKEVYKNRSVRTKVLVIVGPTASGKSGLGVRLAKKLNGEIISADSRQVYRGLTIGTGKITKREMKGVRHHLLDIADPKRVFTAYDFAIAARAAIEDIARRGKLPIMVGGSAFYIDAALGKTKLANVRPDAALRHHLRKKTLPELKTLLKELAPRRYLTIDKQNPVRLIRAIEVALAAEKTAELPKPRYEAVTIGIRPKDSQLRANIAKRLHARIREGMVAEAKRLRRRGLRLKRMRELGLEYRYLADYLEGKLSKEEMLTRLEAAIWQFSRRQMTWWKRDNGIRWFSSAKKALSYKFQAGPPRLERGMAVLETAVLPIKL